MRGIVATFLFHVRRRDHQVSIGAAVNHRAQIVILLPKGLPLSMHEATELQKKIREAVVRASMLGH